MEITTIQKQIKDKSVNNFYIMSGEEIAVQDIYIKKIAECKQLNILRADTIAEITIKLNNKAFISSNYCYIIHNDNDFLKAENSWDKVISSIGNNILILVYDNIDKRSKFYKRFINDIAVFEHLGEDILIKYIQKQIDLSVNNCKMLIDICEYDYSRILLEIDKIFQFKDYDFDTDDKMADKAFIQLVNDGTIYRPPKDAIFDLVDSVCRGQIDKSYLLYEDCKAINESPLAIISVLYNNMKQMLQVQSCNNSDIAKSTGLTNWQIMQAKDKIGAYSVRELVNDLKVIQKTEQAIKTGEMEQDMAIDYIMLNILR